GPMADCDGRFRAVAGVDVPPEPVGRRLFAEGDDLDADHVHFARECGPRVDHLPYRTVRSAELHRTLDRPDGTNPGPTPLSAMAAARELAPGPSGLGPEPGPPRPVDAVPAQPAHPHGQARRPADAVVRHQETSDFFRFT